MAVGGGSAVLGFSAFFHFREKILNLNIKHPTKFLVMWQQPQKFLKKP